MNPTDIESHLSADQVRIIYSDLQNIITSGQNRVKVLEGIFTQIDGSFSDAVDAADANNQRTETLADIDREKQAIRAAQRALGRIDELGELGYCSECDVDIPFKRLKIAPTTTLCVDCKQAQEKFQRIHRHA
ncbi:TraR/DksA family transcriptional regulator [Ferrimonas marina]|uniref:Transcriptional regulator, TraR/DksA family n=1 Tax=Ferrimonas marina TaxID=299255 RepID=A0A1M5TGY5_9GAMM|nr:TraR/DksA family transcriptional regulator [Ferrimonas marina]SHH49921.1 transcriptional regulator, TraR/DksA family [Ferrimonas marina]